MNAPATTATLSQLRDVAVHRAPPADITLGFSSAQGFDLLQRGAKLLASSTLVPKEFQGNIPNCVIALNMAQRMGADPLLVMQNLYVVHGRPGWSSQFLIATFNQNGRYSTLRYEFIGEQGKPTWGCRAWAVERDTNEKLVGADITLQMAQDEGWSTKAGSKWKTMPQQMLMYRSASFFIRTHAPEIAMGLQTREELIDTIDTIDIERDGTVRMTSDEAAPKRERPKVDAEDVPTATDSAKADAEKQADQPAMTFAQVATAIKAAKTADALDIAADLIGAVEDAEQRTELTDLYEHTRTRLKPATA